MTEFGDLKPLEDLGLVHSTPEGQARYGTYRFWSPTSYREYYIKRYPKKSPDRNVWVKRVHDSKGQGTGLQHCTWDEAVSWITAKNRHFTLKIEKMLKKSIRKPGDTFYTLDVGDIFPERKWNDKNFDEKAYDVEHKRVVKELLGYFKQLRKRFDDLRFAHLWHHAEDQDEAWKIVIDHIEKGWGQVAVEGSDAPSAISFLRATYQDANVGVGYWVPCQAGKGATWESTDTHPSKWVDEGP